MHAHNLFIFYLKYITLLFSIITPPVGALRPLCHLTLEAINIVVRCHVHDTRMVHDRPSHIDANAETFDHLADIPEAGHTPSPGAIALIPEYF